MGPEGVTVIGIGIWKGSKKGVGNGDGWLCTICGYVMARTWETEDAHEGSEERQVH